MAGKLLSFSAVARAAGITRPTLYSWQSSGRFAVKPFDDRKPSRWTQSDIDDWLKSDREKHHENDQPRLEGI